MEDFNSMPLPGGRYLHTYWEHSLHAWNYSRLWGLPSLAPTLAHCLGIAMRMPYAQHVGPWRNSNIRDRDRIECQSINVRRQTEKEQEPSKSANNAVYPHNEAGFKLSMDIVLSHVLWILKTSTLGLQFLDNFTASVGARRLTFDDVNVILSGIGVNIAI